MRKCARSSIPRIPHKVDLVGRLPDPLPIRSSLTGAQIAEQLDQFLVSAGALARVNDAGRDHGQIRAFNNRTFDIAKARAYAGDAQ